MNKWQIILQKVSLKATMTERPQPEDSLENEKNDNNKTNTHKKTADDTKMCSNLSFVRFAKD